MNKKITLILVLATLLALGISVASSKVTNVKVGTPVTFPVDI